MFENRTTDDLCRIAMAGGGFHLDARNRTTDDLARLAMAATKNSARITLAGLGNRSIDDIARISMAGRGCIIFVD